MSLINEALKRAEADKLRNSADDAVVQVPPSQEPVAAMPRSSRGRLIIVGAVAVAAAVAAWAMTRESPMVFSPKTAMAKSVPLGPMTPKATTSPAALTADRQTPAAKSAAAASVAAAKGGAGQATASAAKDAADSLAIGGDSEPLQDGGAPAPSLSSVAGPGLAGQAPSDSPSAAGNISEQAKALAASVEAKTVLALQGNAGNVLAMAEATLPGTGKATGPGSLLSPTKAEAKVSAGGQTSLAAASAPVEAQSRPASAAASQTSGVIIADAGAASKPSAKGDDGPAPVKSDNKPASRPAATSKPTSAPAKLDAANFKVSGILVGSDGGTAIINGRFMKTGQTIDGAKVIRITDHAVELDLGGPRPLVVGL